MKYLSGNFDVGYLHGSNVVRIRNGTDLSEIWANIQKGSSITLWCDGLKKSCSKRARPGDWSSEDEQEEFSKSVNKRRKTQEKSDKVDATIKELKGKNGDNAYTPMQYRVWAEMIIGGVHKSIEHAPTSTMFIRAGSGRKNSEIGVTGSSPAKQIENRTKCYKQLADIKNLYESGVLSKEEYGEEKDTIMGMLRQLK